MAVCDYCNQEMLEADGCVDDAILIEGVAYEPVRYGDEYPRWKPDRRCHDCGIVAGRVHHHGCDVERCPACGIQSISCDCVWAGEEHLTEEWVEELEERFLVVGPDE